MGIDLMELPTGDLGAGEKPKIRRGNARPKSSPDNDDRATDTAGLSGAPGVVRSGNVGDEKQSTRPSHSRPASRITANGNDVVALGFRAPEACHIVGITYRQLDYWTRTNLVRPSLEEARGSGTRRLYSFRDLVLLKAVKDLIDAGMSLQKVREAIDYVRTAVSEDPTETTLVARQGTIVVVKPQDRDLLIDALRRGQITLSLPLAPIYEELRQKVREIEAARRRHPSTSRDEREPDTVQLSLFGESGLDDQLDATP